MTATTPADNRTNYKVPEEPSSSLDAIFDEILLKVDNDLQSRVTNSLKWLVFSFERLTIDLLVEVFVQDTDRNAPLNEAEKLFSTPSVLECLSGLVAVDEQHVWLAESSLKEYLTSTRIRQGPASAFSFTEAEAHLHIAHSSLIHHLDCNPQGIPSEEQNASKLKTYAARNWPLHLEKVPRSSWPLETAQAANLALTLRSPSLFSMIDSFPVCPFLSTDGWTNPLIYTAYLGATQLTEMLISEGLDMHEYITQWDLDVALLNAGSAGHLETVRLLVDKGASIDSENATRRNPVTQAALQGHIEVVRFFIENEVMAAALDGTDIRKWALSAAAAQSHFDIIELLVRNGTEIDEYTLKKVAGSSRDEAAILECLQLLLDNRPDITKEEALCKAAYSENWKAFDLLLGKGADINALGSRWGNPLHIACAALDIDQSRIEYLLGLGADPNVQGGFHGTALQAVCYSYSSRDEEACIKVAKLLISLGVDIAAQGGEHDNALKSACASKGSDGKCWYNMVELLLKNGADVNAQGGPYANALQVACHHENSDLVPLLLAWGADVNFQGGAFPTALHAACHTRPKEGKDGDVKMVQLLLDHGADINATGKGQLLGTAFHAACKAGNLKIVRLLLERGADVNLQGGGYGSALYSACQWGNLEVVRFLLENGVDVNAPVRKIMGRTGTALLTACSFWRNDEEMVHLLLDHGAHIRVPGVSSASVLRGVASSDRGTDNSLLRRFLELGADINQTDEFGGAALHYALRKMRFNDKGTKASRIRLLIEHGADIHLAAGKLGSPLYCICATPTGLYNVYENDRTTALFLEICPDIDVNAQCGEYGSALQAAAWSGQTESVKLLIKKGAHVNMRGGKYGSALNAAIIMGYWNIVKILLDNGATPDFHLRDEMEDDWFAEVRRVHERGAVERYRKFWEVGKRKFSKEQTQITA
ncbi:ankyrin repeat-containing domain protein [Trichoderma velutinum]